MVCWSALKNRLWMAYHYTLGNQHRKQIQCFSQFPVLSVAVTKFGSPEKYNISQVVPFAQKNAHQMQGTPLSGSYRLVTLTSSFSFHKLCCPGFSEPLNPSITNYPKSLAGTLKGEAHHYLSRSGYWSSKCQIPKASNPNQSWDDQNDFPVGVIPAND